MVISRLVVGKLNTALATKARARAARSAGGRPTKPRQDGRNASIRSRPSMLTNALCCALSGRSRAIAYLIETSCQKQNPRTATTAGLMRARFIRPVRLRSGRANGA